MNYKILYKNCFLKFNGLKNQPNSKKQRIKSYYILCKLSVSIEMICNNLKRKLVSPPKLTVVFVKNKTFIYLQCLFMLFYLVLLAKIMS